MNIAQRNAFDTLMRHTTMLRMEFDSSAEFLERQIRERGIVPPIKLFYEYKYPDNLTPQQYEVFVQRLVFILLVYVPEMINDNVGYNLRYFQKSISKLDNAQLIDQVRSGVARDIRECYGALSKLTDAERAQMIDAFAYDTPRARELARKNINMIKLLNPQLADVRVNMDDDFNMLDFLQGATYGFAPEEIDYFLNTTMEERNAVPDPLENSGLNVWYKLRPDRAQKIADAVHLNNMATHQNTGNRE